MPIDESEIEERVVAYMRNTLGRNEIPNRHNAIRDITGQVEILPSAVARVITRMIDAGTLRHLKSNDKLEFVE